MAKKYQIFLCFVAGAVFVSGCGLPHEKHEIKPNVLLIHIDALRPDHLGCYGHFRDTSPHIDKLAREGAIFLNAITQAAYTGASNSSFITATYPFRRFMSSAERATYMNPEDMTLPAILNEHGYATCMITDHPIYLGKIEGLQERFGAYIELETNNPQALTQRALDWISFNKNKPFFLWLYYFGVHGAYRPPSPYKEMFLRDGLGGPHKEVPIAASTVNAKAFGNIPSYVAEDGIADVGHYIAQYDGTVRFVDEEIGRVLQALKRAGIEKNTIVILTADHGESLGEHDYYFSHGLTLYEEVLKVPLIIRWPTQTFKNKIIDAQVRLMDVVPTILDMLRIKKALSMAGASFLSCLSRNKCETPEFAFSRALGPIFSLRNPGWKLIYIERNKIHASSSPFSRRMGDHYERDYELYDLKSDPGELHNAADEKSDVFMRLKKILDGYVREAERQQAKVREEVEKGQWPYQFAPGPDAEIEEKLKSIGYAQ